MNEEAGMRQSDRDSSFRVKRSHWSFSSWGVDSSTVFDCGVGVVAGKLEEGRGGCCSSSDER